MPSCWCRLPKDSVRASSENITYPCLCVANRVIQLHLQRQEFLSVNSTPTYFRANVSVTIDSVRLPNTLFCMWELVKCPYILNGVRNAWMKIR